MNARKYFWCRRCYLARRCRYETFKKMLVQTVPCQAAALDLRNGRATVLALRQMQYENALRLVTLKNPYELYKLARELEKVKEREVDHMLIFYCTDCKKMITGEDSESIDQIVDRLDEHLTKCPLSTFTHEGTSGIARRRLSGLRSFLEGEGLAQLHSPVPTEFEKLSERIAQLKLRLR
jgi:hypothetical protein